jgi:ATP-dependent helicase/DNAse subunit B
LSKEIWLGPVLGTNRERLLARCAEYIARGETNRLLYLAASHPLLDLVTEKLLDGESASGVWGEFPVYLFRGLVRRIVSEARPSGRATQPAEPLLTRGLLTRVPIDREDLPLRRSLISQIIKQLNAAGQLSGMKTLANRDGCVNTIATLIGELQRAGKTAEEFRQAVEERDADTQFQSPKSKAQRPGAKDQISESKFQSPKSQLDFDRDVALIYQTYAEALERYGLTDEDAEQLRALQLLRSELEENEGVVSSFSEVDLLVLDGFFDFTPVQGEILKCLIPQVSNVIVNLNHDAQNEEIFRPFQSTIDQLQSIAPFETKASHDLAQVNQSLAALRSRLFNVSTESEPDSEEAGNASAPALQMLECADREIEIRSIAKEIKRLVINQDYKLSDLALVVRERAAYADTIARVFAAESIPCNLERRVDANDVPAVRACGKLFQLLKDAPEQVKNPKTSDIAHLIKTDYFRASDQSLEELTKLFDTKHAYLLLDSQQPNEPGDKLRKALGIGLWRSDDLENVIAYVGSELRVDGWIDRALKLIRVFPSPGAAQTLIAGDEPEDAAVTAQDEAPPEDGAAMDRRKKPAPVHPASIAWAVLIMRHVQQLLSAMPEAASVEELRSALMILLDQLQFSNQVNVPFECRSGASDIPQATLDVRGRESLRRAIVAAVRSFSYASVVVSEARPSGRASKETDSLKNGLLPQTQLSSFIEEVERCLKSQVLAISAGNRDGLRVLEATDVRGLRFRVVFIAGMIEGGFPLRASRDWLYPHEERVRLQKHGVFLEDISSETLLKEEHYFYQAACRATDRLYLSRPLALNDGAETVASYYVEELRRAVAPLEIEFKQFRSDIDRSNVTEASTPTEFSTILIRQSALRNRSRLTQPEIEGLLLRAGERGFLTASAFRRIEIEHERAGEWFGPYDGEITNADLRAMLARHFGAEHVYSASRLSTFGNCAFRFFGNRVLRIEPRSEAALDLQAIDAGKLLHDILRRFFEKHRREYLPDRDRDELRADLAATADEVFKEHEDKVPPLNERIWKIDCEIRKLILDQVLLYELRLQEKTSDRGVLPAYFELAFGRASAGSDPHSVKDYLKFERAGGSITEAALIQGQIDRVDLSQDGRVAVAYDYKLSEGAKLDDLRSGRQVQIPIYLAALEQLFLPEYELAGGGYYTLRGKGPRLNRGLYRLAFADCTSVTSPRAKMSDDDWRRIRRDVERRVWEFIDQMRSGRFRVKPSLGRLTCKFCDYSAVCRYDAYRINRKLNH